MPDRRGLATAVVLLVVVLLRSQRFVWYLYFSWTPTVFTPTMVCTAAGARAGLVATPAPWNASSGSVIYATYAESCCVDAARCACEAALVHGAKQCEIYGRV